VTYPMISEEFDALQQTPDIPENMVYTTIDKFQVRQGPVDQPPYKCASCGNPIISKDQWFVDWLFTLDYYGQVIFCTDCVRQMCNQLGYMDPGQVRQLVEAKSKLIQQVSELINENMELRNALGAIGIVTRDSEFVRAVSVADSSEREASGPEVGDSPVDQSVADRESVETEQGSVQSTPVERSAVVSGDDTLDELLRDSI